MRHWRRNPQTLPPPAPSLCPAVDKLTVPGSIVAASDAEALDITVTLVCIGMAVLGTNLSRRLLDAMSDAQFRTWSVRLVALTGTVYLGQGLFLLAMG